MQRGYASVASEDECSGRRKHGVREMLDICCVKEW